MSEEFIREVDEELKEEKAAKLWKKVGPYVISFAVGIVLFTSGIVGWNNYTEMSRQQLGDDFSAAVELIKDDDFDSALIALEEITDKSSDGYVTMAKMKQASILIDKKQIEEGLDIYSDLEKTAVDQSFKDMSTILFVINALDYKSPDLLLEKIERLTNDNNSWAFSALELKAYIYVKKGEINSAKQIFQQILDKKSAPSTLAGRARDMVEYLDGN
ncbi:MAG: hypothetical protein CBE14_003175 [Rickettsiales bacterium TMED254]|mgnify:FL=1|nr:hypothetical protein [Rickettsiales bacterium]RPF75961.1 MAG: hypothetical protein CBE14_003175 [Rickettsiales bacterium TMED254]